ncbi:MAG: ATP-binding cassette domain-containing protein [Gammaproteobacteria bacterium]|nr:MAG: ATP-binding cassette domain-containing protein [Gammaproteobacteria bacterium]
MPSIPASTDPTRAGAADGAPATEAVLRLSALTVAFDTPGGTVTAAREVTLAVARGECLGVVGESGAGKSQLFLAVLGLLPGNARTQGSARFRGSELLTLEPAMLDHVSARWSCCAGCRSPIPSAAYGSTRTSSPEACVSA